MQGRHVIGTPRRNRGAVRCWRRAAWISKRYFLFLKEANVNISALREYLDQQRRKGIGKGGKTADRLLLQAFKTTLLRVRALS